MLGASKSQTPRTISDTEHCSADGPIQFDQWSCVTQSRFTCANTVLCSAVSAASHLDTLQQLQAACYADPLSAAALRGEA